MYRKKKVAVIVPAYNEEHLVGKTVQTLPVFVDYVTVIDDGSTDRTSEIVRELMASDPHIRLIVHEKNMGVGAAIRTGYTWARDTDADITVVMNGDNQMDPHDLPALLDPLVEDQADYVKGNRLITGEAWSQIPRIRYLGNSVLSFLTKFTSGYFHISDSQSGYTAINRRALAALPLKTLYPGFGVPNDILVKLNINYLRVMDVPVKPVYGVGERSDLKIQKVIFSIPILLIRLFFHRMFQKYLIRDFHPIILCYSISGLLFTVAVPLSIRLFIRWIESGRIMPMNLLTVVFCVLAALQTLFIAIFFDIDQNQKPKGKSISESSST
ncbi:glycosyltransferase family 2 protein [Candidatus Latescibacterota bacterium]